MAIDIATVPHHPVTEELPRRETKAVGNLRAIRKLVRPRESGSVGVGGGQDKAEPLRQRRRTRAQPAVSGIGGGTGVEWGRLPCARDARYELVGPQAVAGHDALESRRFKHAAGDYAVKRFAGHPLGDQRKRLVVGIAISPARSGREPARRGRGQSDVGCNRRRGIIRQRTVAFEPEEIRQARRLREQMRDAKAGFVSEPLGQVLPDARVKPDFARVDECHDRRRSELFRNRTERKYRRCIGRWPAGSDRAVTPLQNHFVAAGDRNVRRRDAFLRHEGTHRRVGLGDINSGHRWLGEEDSQQGGQGNHSSHAGHPTRNWRRSTQHSGPTGRTCRHSWPDGDPFS